jgi:ABC-type tungstate transport system substrate-binding protein
MRATVIALNILSVVLGLLYLPIVRMFGALGVLAIAHDEPGETVLGLVIAATPVVVPAGSILISQYLLKRRRPASILVAALPVIIACLFVAARYALVARRT